MENRKLNEVQKTWSGIFLEYLIENFKKLECQNQKKP